MQYKEQQKAPVSSLDILLVFSFLINLIKSYLGIKLFFSCILFFVWFYLFVFVSWLNLVSYLTQNTAITCWQATKWLFTVTLYSVVKMFSFFFSKYSATLRSFLAELNQRIKATASWQLFVEAVRFGIKGLGKIRLADVALKVALKGCMCLQFNFEVEIPISIEEEMKKPTPDLLAHYGYKCESHFVTTEDNYILQLFRINPKEGEKKKEEELSTKLPETKAPPKRRTPVLIHHGIFSSSGNFVFNPPEHSLGTYLTDAGYDVWLANARGTEYSRKHKTFDADKDAEYWDFSWDDIGQKDLPAAIDYIIGETGYKQVNYIGHSMGGTVMFVLLSSRPEYNDKIKAFYAMAPAVYISGIRRGLGTLARLDDVLWELYNSINGGMEVTSDETTSLVQRIVCTWLGRFGVKMVMCFLLGAKFTSTYDGNRMPVYLRHLPNGVSAKQVYHFSQIVKSDKFHAFDGGPERNMELYNGEKAPEFDLSKVSARVIAFGGDSDTIVPPEGLQRLISEVQNATLIRVSDPSFSHMDFTWAKAAPQLIYEPIIKFLEEGDKSLED